MKVADNIPAFSIAVIAQLTDTPIRMLREYEKQGLIRPNKINGRRMYTGCEVGFVRDIRYYLAERRMTISGLKEFYLRSGCWEIKRCHRPKCPAYGNINKQCWQVVKNHKHCSPEICPFCPIFIIKTVLEKKKDVSLNSPLAYPGK
jgi:hypothetical protein